MSLQTPRLDAELERFGQQLLEAAETETAAPSRRRRPSRRLTLTLTLALLLLVPATIASVDRFFLADDRPMREPPPGFTVPRVQGPVVDVTAGQTADGGAWRAYGVRCGTRVSVVIVMPDGTRTSAACGAVRRGQRRAAAPAFAPATTYDGVSQTTFIYAAVPPTVAQVHVELSGRAQDGPIKLPGAGRSQLRLAPLAVADARAKLRRNVRFIVVVRPGDQRVLRATARDAAGRVLSRCRGGRCEPGSR